jgi:hypothetical protein
MHTYAIIINERTLDLIRVLNNGGPTKIEKKTTYFVFAIDGPNTTTNHDIWTEDQLYEWMRKTEDNSWTLLLG